MIIGLGLLQDEYALTGEFQIFDGWSQRLQSASLSVRLFSPAGQRLRALPFLRHETGESLLRTAREQWLFIRQACAVSRSVDLLHLFLPTANFLWIADRIKKKAGKPVVVTCLCEKPGFAGAMDLRALWGAPRFHLLRHAASWILSEGKFLCDRYVAGTAAVAAQLRRSGCAPRIITVQPPFLAPEAPPDEASLSAAGGFDSDRTFLYLGHFLPSKGVDLLLKGFAALADPQSRLVLAWSGIGRVSEIRRLSDRLGISGRVSILEFPVHRSTLFSRSRALVLPCPVSYGQTSPPMALLEAFRAGVPVVTSWFPHLRFLGGEGETMQFVRPGDWRGIGLRMRQMLDHPEEAELMRQEQRARFRRIHDAFDPNLFYEGVLRNVG
jgi:glycosyltransferase involved in cell wall biosynthesis